MGQSNISGPLFSANGIRLGGGTTITKVLRGTVSVNPASLADNAIADTSITILGAVVGDSVQLNPPTAGLTAGILIVGAWVSAADTVKVRLANLSGGTVDEAAADWTYLITRS